MGPGLTRNFVVVVENSHKPGAKIMKKLNYVI